MTFDDFSMILTNLTRINGRSIPYWNEATFHSKFPHDCHAMHCPCKTKQSETWEDAWQSSLGHLCNNQLDLTLCIDAVAEEGIESLQAGPCHVTISEGRPVMQLLSETGS